MIFLPKNNVYGGFLQALFLSGSVTIPNFLFDHYIDLGMTDREIVLVIHVLKAINENRANVDCDEQIMRKMAISLEEYKNLVQGLQHKGLLMINAKSKNKKEVNHPYYDFSGLTDQLFELWGIIQYRMMEGSVNQNAKDQEQASSSDLSLATLIAIFEEELGRMLTGFECENIEKWLMASYSEELIVEALRRGVGAGIRSFRYLDSILREWEKKGIKTKLEAEAEDQNFQARQAKKGEKKAQAKTKNKYDNIYL